MQCGHAALYLLQRLKVRFPADKGQTTLTHLQHIKVCVPAANGPALYLLQRLKVRFSATKG